MNNSIQSNALHEKARMLRKCSKLEKLKRNFSEYKIKKCFTFNDNLIKFDENVLDEKEDVEQLINFCTQSWTSCWKQCQREADRLLSRSVLLFRCQWKFTLFIQRYIYIRIFSIFLSQTYLSGFWRVQKPFWQVHQLDGSERQLGQDWETATRIGEQRFSVSFWLFFQLLILSIQEWLNVEKRIFGYNIAIFTVLTKTTWAILICKLYQIEPYSHLPCPESKEAVKALLDQLVVIKVIKWLYGEVSDHGHMNPIKKENGCNLFHSFYLFFPNFFWIHLIFLLVELLD